MRNVAGIALYCIICMVLNQWYCAAGGVTMKSRRPKNQLIFKEKKFKNLSNMAKIPFLGRGDGMG